MLGLGSGTRPSSIFNVVRHNTTQDGSKGLHFGGYRGAPVTFALWMGPYPDMVPPLVLWSWHRRVFHQPERDPSAQPGGPARWSGRTRGRPVARRRRGLGAQQHQLQCGHGRVPKRRGRKPTHRGRPLENVENMVTSEVPIIMYKSHHTSPIMPHIRRCKTVELFW